jgi:hypothetical protein
MHAAAIFACKQRNVIDKNSWLPQVVNPFVFFFAFLRDRS